MKEDIILKAKNLAKIYGKGSSKLLALDDIDLEIKAGESIAIVGKSGSGKSTLMHLLALLDKPSSGSIEIDGRLTSKLKSAELDKVRSSKFGFVFQQFFMNARDSVIDNVALPLKISGMSRRQRHKKAKEVLRVVGLSEKAKNRAQDLSGGQKQRVCVARAIITEPDIIFADEPTGNLDSVTGQKIIDLLFNINRERGITLIVVTHDSNLAQACDRQVNIMDGHITSIITNSEPKKGVAA